MSEDVTFLIYTEATAKAIRKAAGIQPTKGENTYHAKGKPQIMLPSPQTPMQNGNQGYNGYFKAEMFERINTNGDTETVVRIYDGENSYPPDATEEDFIRQWAGSCYVNSKVYSVKPFFKVYDDDYNSKSYAYFLKFTIDNTSLTDKVDIVEIESADESITLPDADSNTAWYLIATYNRDSGKFIQRFTGSVPQLFWFKNCSEEVSNA